MVKIKNQIKSIAKGNEEIEKECWYLVQLVQEETNRRLQKIREELNKKESIEILKEIK